MKKMVKAYAKVNLGLQVVKKTRRGYHKLRMVMSLIDLYDEVWFYENDKIIVDTSNNVCLMEDNLCYKVAIYLQKKYKINKGIQIYINKMIPDGGGLGGGSSDAAEVLKFLNEYWGLKLSKRKLKKIGFIFGCDIPYFIEGQTAYVTSFGERVKPLVVKKREDDILVVIPDFKMNTKLVFENHVIQKEISIKNLIKAIKNTEDYRPYMFNDLEETVDKLRGGKIKELKSKMKKYGCGFSLMSGSGSTVIGYFLGDKNNIEEVKKQIDQNETKLKVFVTKLKMYSY